VVAGQPIVVANLNIAPGGFVQAGQELMAIVLVPWELTRTEPIVDLKILGQRNFSIAFLLMMVIGAVVFGTTQFLPQLMQQVLGYTATQAGMALTVGGLATILVMPVAGILSTRVDPQSAAQAAQTAPAVIYQQLQTQAAMLSFVDAFHALLIVIIVLTPTIFLLRGAPPGARAGGGH
jgi:DHA2 family multidrug resistance protein